MNHFVAKLAKSFGGAYATERKSRTPRVFAVTKVERTRFRPLVGFERCGIQVNGVVCSDVHMGFDPMPVSFRTLFTIGHEPSTRCPHNSSGLRMDELGFVLDPNDRVA